MKKILAFVLAYLFLGLAIIGVVLPGVPTVPFLLLSAWFATRGSSKLRLWLYEHPKFGPILVNWEQEKAVSRSSKITAVLMMCASWIILFNYADNPWLLAGVSGLFVVVSGFIITRPEPCKH